MSQLTKADEYQLREIRQTGTVSPEQFKWLILTAINRVLMDLDYARAHPDRPLDDIVPKD